MLFLMFFSLIIYNNIIYYKSSDMIPNSYINTIKYGKNWRFSKVIDKQMTNVTVTD